MKSLLKKLLGKNVKIISYFGTAEGILCFFEHSKQYDTIYNNHSNKLFFTVSEINSINGNTIILK